MSGRLPNQADEPALMIEKRQCVAYITLNRETSLNAINNEIRDTFPKLLAQLDRARDVRAVVITGSGSRAFCVGADIKELRATGSIIELRKSFRHNGWIEALDDFSKPTIAAINGYCLGGGMELALACDIRIASSNSVFGLPEVNLGLIPAAGGTQRLPRLIGLGRALDLLITGEKINASSAKRFSLAPTIPTIAESGIPEYDGGTIWFGVTGPAGVPTGIVNKLNSEFNMALRLPEIRQKIEQNLGYEIVGGSPQDFIAQLSNEIRKMKQIAKQAGIVPQ